MTTVVFSFSGFFEVDKADLSAMVSAVEATRPTRSELIDVVESHLGDAGYLDGLHDADHEPLIMAISAGMADHVFGQFDGRYYVDSVDGSPTGVDGRWVNALSPYEAANAFIAEISHDFDRLESSSVGIASCQDDVMSTVHHCTVYDAGGGYGHCTDHDRIKDPVSDMLEAAAAGLVSSDCGCGCGEMYALKSWAVSACDMCGTTFRRRGRSRRCSEACRCEAALRASIACSRDRSALPCHWCAELYVPGGIELYCSAQCRDARLQQREVERLMLSQMPKVNDGD